MNVLIFFATCLALMIEERYFCLSLIFTLMAHGKPSPDLQLLKAGAIFMRRRSNMGGVPTSKRTIMLICSVLSCLLNLDLGKGNA